MKHAFYIAHTQTPGQGTKTRPLNGNQFDAAIAVVKSAMKTSPKAPTKIVVGPGEFTTRGIAPLENWEIILHRDTVLKLTDVGTTGFHYPNNYVIASAWHGRSDGPAWLESFTLSGGTLDCNWPNQSARLEPGVKFGGVYSVAAKTTIRGVRIINFGSNGLTVAGQPDWEHAECFPLMAETYADETTSILIECCTVEQGYFHRGGYATAICVVTTQDRPGQDRGDRVKWGERKSLCALVRNNVARGIYGNALGCAWSECARFQHNTAEECKTGSNIDTGRNRKIEFIGNQFLACNQGLQIGQFYSGEFTDYTIRNNLFHLTGPWPNVFLKSPQTEYGFGVRLTKFPKRIMIRDNTFLAWPLFERDDGMFGIGWCDGAEKPILAGNRFIGVGTPETSDTPFHMP